MINLFLIKNKLKNKTNIQNNNNEIIEKYKRIAQSGNEEVIKEFYTNIEKGLTEKEAEQRLEKDGENIVIKEEEHSWFYFFINSFKDKFILILVILAIINQLVSSDNIGTIIIFAIGFVSAMIRFIQDYSTYKFNQKLKSQLFSNATVVRNGREKIIKTEKVVKGDIIHLNAGAIIPADVMIVENRDLFLNQSVFTGESAPVEKTEKYADTNEIFSLSNICLMGTSVISGKATAVVINTGFSTYLGSMGKQINSKKEITNFERGMNNITKLLIRYMVVVSIAVFVIYAFIRKDVLEAILFALSVAVGITPTMLPMIVNVNLTKGTKTLAKKKTLVKNIQSIQNLGTIDILCTDKTGTLTLDKIILQKYINVEGKEDLSILEYAFLNSYYGTGMKNLVDRAVIAYGNQHQIKDKIADYEKVDEIPFDYTRKKMSVVVEHDGHYRIITKGALEEVLKSCTTVKINNQHEPLTQELIENINTNAQKLAKQGMQVIALASKREYSGKNEFNEFRQDLSDTMDVDISCKMDPPDQEKFLSDVANHIFKAEKTQLIYLSEEASKYGLKLEASEHLRDNKQIDEQCRVLVKQYENSITEPNPYFKPGKNLMAFADFTVTTKDMEGSERFLTMLRKEVDKISDKDMKEKVSAAVENDIGLYKDELNKNITYIDITER